MQPPRVFGVAESRSCHMRVAESFNAPQAIAWTAVISAEKPLCDLSPTDAVLMVNKCTFSLRSYCNFFGSSSVSVNDSKSSHDCLSYPFTPQTAQSPTHYFLMVKHLSISVVQLFWVSIAIIIMRHTFSDVLQFTIIYNYPTYNQLYC